MLVVDVGKVRMVVEDGLVAMAVRVGLPLWHSPLVVVPVVLVVDVRVLVLELRMAVLVRVVLRQVEPDPDAHQRARQHELSRPLVAEERHATRAPRRTG